jgi:hypothetical protein
MPETNRYEAFENNEIFELTRPDVAGGYDKLGLVGSDFIKSSVDLSVHWLQPLPTFVWKEFPQEVLCVRSLAASSSPRSSGVSRAAARAGRCVTPAGGVSRVALR